MIFSNLSVYVPLLTPLPPLPPINENIQQIYDIYTNSLSELSSISGQIEFPLEYDTVKVKFELFDRSDENVPKPIKIRSKFRVEKILKISSKIPIHLNKSYNDLHPGIDTLYIEKDSIKYLYIKRIHDLIISLNIAKVGCIEIDEGIVIQDRKHVGKIDQMINDLSSVYYFTLKTEWPKLELLDFLTVWNWIVTKDGFLNGVGGSRIERALTALTYSFGTTSDFSEDSNLFWIMIGLEALYSNSNIGISEQIRKKSQILLGKKEKYKKIFNNMYDFRSRFIHGDIDFPGKYHIYDALESFNKYSDKTHETELMAQAILIATLQNLVKQKANNIDFEYNMIIS